MLNTLSSSSSSYQPLQVEFFFRHYFGIGFIDDSQTTLLLSNKAFQLECPHSYEQTEDRLIPFTRCITRLLLDS
jgi:hypothetical protein